MKSPERCLQQITGSCSGCNIIEIAILGMRWKAKTLEEQQQHIEEHYCPDGCNAESLQKHTNKEAAYLLGQRRAENTEFDDLRKPLRGKPSKGLPNGRISKAKTGKWFV